MTEPGKKHYFSIELSQKGATWTLRYHSFLGEWATIERDSLLKVMQEFALRVGNLIEDVEEEG